MIVMVLIAAAMSIATGVALVLAWLGPPRHLPGMLICLCAGAALGLPLHAATDFAALQLADGRFGVVLLLDVALLGVAGWLALTFVRHRPASIGLVGLVGTPRSRWGEGVALVTVVGVMIAASMAALAYIRSDLHGNWDAWATWNVKARFFFRGESNWRDAFNPHLTGMWHDYPLWLPLTIHRLWRYAGSDTLFVPQGVSLAALFALTATLFAWTWCHRGILLACLAVLLMLSSPRLIFWSAMQYADLWFAWFMLSSVTCLTLAQPHQRSRWWVLAGIFASAAAFTKNEGLLFCLVMIVVGCVMAWRGHGARLRTAAGLVIAMVPGVALVLATKALTGSGGVQYLGDEAGVFARLFDGSRHVALITTALDRAALTFDPWAIILMAIVAAACGSNARPAHIHAAKVLLLVIGLMVAGYYITLLNTSMDIEWHTRTAADRLMLHLWPLLCLTVALLVRSPGRPR